MVVRSIRDDSGRAPPTPLFARATLARADETDKFSMATTACRRRRASVIEPSGLEARDASSRASEANTKEENQSSSKQSLSRGAASLARPRASASRTQRFDPRTVSKPPIAADRPPSRTTDDRAV